MSKLYDNYLISIKTKSIKNINKSDESLSKDESIRIIKLLDNNLKYRNLDLEFTTKILNLLIKKHLTLNRLEIFDVIKNLHNNSIKTIFLDNTCDITCAPELIKYNNYELLELYIKGLTSYIPIEMYNKYKSNIDFIKLVNKYEKINIENINYDLLDIITSVDSDFRVRFEYLERNSYLDYIFISKELDLSQIKTYYKVNEQYYRLFDKYDIKRDIHTISVDHHKNRTKLKLNRESIIPKDESITELEDVDNEDNFISLLLYNNLIEYNVLDNIDNDNDILLYDNIYNRFLIENRGLIERKLKMMGYTNFNNFLEKNINQAFVHELTTRCDKLSDKYKLHRNVVSAEDFDKAITSSYWFYQFNKENIDWQDKSIKLRCYIPNTDIYTVYNTRMIINKYIKEPILGYNTLSSVRYSEIVLRLEFTNTDYFIYKNIDDIFVFLFPINTVLKVIREPYIDKRYNKIIVPVTIYSQELSTPGYVDSEFENEFNNIWDYYNIEQYRELCKYIDTEDLVNIIDNALISNFHKLSLIKKLDQKFHNFKNKNFVKEFLTRVFDNNFRFLTNLSEIFSENVELLSYIYPQIHLNILNKYISSEKDYSGFLQRIVNKIRVISDINFVGITPINNYIEDLIKTKPNYVKILADNGCINFKILLVNLQYQILTKKLLTKYNPNIFSQNELRFIFATDYKIDDLKMITTRGINKLRINNTYDMEYSENSVKCVFYEDNLIFLPNIINTPLEVRVDITGNTDESSQTIFKLLRKFSYKLRELPIIETNDTILEQYYQCFSEVIYSERFKSDLDKLLALYDMSFDYENHKSLDYLKRDLIINDRVTNIALCSAFILLKYYTGSDGFILLNKVVRGHSIVDVDKQIGVYDIDNLSINEEEARKMVECLYDFFLETHQKFRRTERIPPCLLQRKFYLFRGENKSNIPISKGSIINALKNQFISFSFRFKNAVGFSNGLVHMLEVDIERDMVLPIGSIKFLGENLSYLPRENEFLLPLNTSFIVSNNIFTYKDVNKYSILPIKIHTQNKVDFTRFTRDGLFTRDELENECHNLFSQFI
jgi:hypothetical protein